MSKSILDYFGSKVKKPVSETLTTSESISDSEIGQEGLIEGEDKSSEAKKSVSETPTANESINNDSEIGQGLIEVDSHRKKSQVKKAISEVEIVPSTAENISANEDYFEVDRDNLLTVSLQQSTGELSEVVPETDYDSDPVELTGEPSHTEVNYESNPESSDILQVAISRSRKIKDYEKYELITSSQNNLRNTDFDTVYFTVSGGRKRKQISFQS